MWRRYRLTLFYDYLCMTIQIESPVPTQSDEQLAVELLDAINRRDFEASSEMLDPNYRAQWPDGQFDLAGAFEREIAMMTGIPDTHFHVSAVCSTTDGRVLVESTVTGTHTGLLELPHGVRLEPTGRKISMKFVMLQRFVDGLLQDEKLSFDHHELIHQLTAEE